MSEKKKINKKDIIKNVAIALLIVLLILTFFSNTFLNMSLPEVSAQYPKYSTLSTAVKASGVIRANDSYNVIFEADAKQDLTQSRKVTSVYYKEGDMVEKDAVIMTLASGNSSQLDDLISQYNSLKSQYDLSKLDDNITALQNNQTISSALDEINKAKENLNKLRGQYDIAVKGGDLSGVLKEELKELQKKYDELTERSTELSSLISELEADISAAKSALKQSGITYEDLQPELTRNQGDYIRAESEFTRINSEVESLQQQVSDLSNQIADMTEAYQITGVIASLNNEIETIRQQMAQSTDIDEIMSLQDQLSDKRSELEEQYMKLNIIGMDTVDEITLYSYNRQLSELQKTLEKKREELSVVSENYNLAKNAYDSTKTLYESTSNLSANEKKLSETKSEYNEAEAQLKELNKSISDLNQKIDSNETLNPEDIATSIKDTENNIREMEAQYQITVASINRSNEATRKEREETLKQIDDLSKKIENYQTAPSTTEITAPISGKIVSINVVPGNLVTSGDSVASIDIAEKGYTCEITMSSDEARRVQVGATCTVVNSWWYSNVNAVVTNIRSDAASQGRQRIVTISVTGDVYDGQNINFQIGNNSEYYSSVLPNSAIRDDNDGKFVLVVESVSTPLGTKYTARRVAISVIASDDTQSAVSGLNGGEFVITNATSPVSDKQQVRLTDQ